MSETSWQVQSDLKSELKHKTTMGKHLFMFERISRRNKALRREDTFVAGDTVSTLCNLQTTSDTSFHAHVLFEILIGSRNYTAMMYKPSAQHSS